MWEREPELPVNVTVALATAADAAAEIVTCTGVPAETVIVVGDTVTPAGNPETCTLTCDAKPLDGSIEIDACADVPVCTERLVGATERVKFGVGVEETCPVLPPPDPQEIISAEMAMKQSNLNSVLEQKEQLLGECARPGKPAMVPP